MKPFAAASAVAFAAISLAACVTTATREADNEPFFVRDAMQQEIEPAITALWDVSNEALDDEGNFDPTLVGEAGWETIEVQAGALEAVMREMAEAPTLVAASPGNLTTQDYEVSMARVQELMDANPAAYRAFASGFAEHAARVRQAAAARDGALTGELVGAADQACQGCHLQFWAHPEG